MRRREPHQNGRSVGTEAIHVIDMMASGMTGKKNDEIAIIATKIGHLNIIVIRMTTEIEIGEINIHTAVAVATKMINEIDETNTTGTTGKTETGVAIGRINEITTRIVATEDPHLATGNEGRALKKARDELAQGASLRLRTTLHQLDPNHCTNFLPLRLLEFLPA